MSDLIIVHHPFQAGLTKSGEKKDIRVDGVVWLTCRRKISFFDELSFADYSVSDTEEIYEGIEAEEFLIEVLCGLKSPLVGETEVFGQFKLWWQSLEDSAFKRKFEARVQQIYSVVKKIREESLCGLGSQSYGSLLRKKISELSAAGNEACIDFVGAGQLVEEMVPWVEKKWKFRIWCRNPERVEGSEIAQKATSVKSMSDSDPVSNLLVVAAPLSHDELNFWIKKRNKGENLHVFDFRHDSMEYNGSDQFSQFLHLDHFTTEVEEKKQQIQLHINEARAKITNWKHNELNRAQVRPFGWDDL
jgi:glutamyl-tRNA reductase